MFRKFIKAGLDRYNAYRARKEEKQFESKEEAKVKEEKSLTYKEAIRKRSLKRHMAHAKYAGGRKFRVRNLTRFLPKVKIRDSKRKISCRAFIVNHEDRDLKGDRLTHTPTGAAARKRHQRAKQRHGIRGLISCVRLDQYGYQITEPFEWPDGGAMIRKIIDMHLTRARK